MCTVVAVGLGPGAEAGTERSGMIVGVGQSQGLSPGETILEHIRTMRDHAGADIARVSRNHMSAQDLCNHSLSSLRHEHDGFAAKESAFTATLRHLETERNETRDEISQQNRILGEDKERLRKIVEEELPEGKAALKDAQETVVTATKRAAPENSRLTKAISIVKRIVASIEASVGAAATEEEERAAETLAKKAQSLLEVAEKSVAQEDGDSNDDEEKEESVGPQFSNAVATLEELKERLVRLRNNSMSVYELKLKRAERKLASAETVLSGLSGDVNRTRASIKNLHLSIKALQKLEANQTQSVLQLRGKMVHVRLGLDRTQKALSAMKKYCALSLDAYDGMHGATQEMASVAGQLDAQVSLKLSAIQAAMSEASLEVLNSAVASAERKSPALAKTSVLHSPVSNEESMMT